MKGKAKNKRGEKRGKHVFKEGKCWGGFGKNTRAREEGGNEGSRTINQQRKKKEVTPNPTGKRRQRGRRRSHFTGA